MRNSAKIALSASLTDDAETYFSFRIKNVLTQEPVEFRQPERVLALSDIEGNFEALCRLLLANKVIDKRMSWIFDDGHLVINGDCFDRGEYVMECLWFLYALEEKAIRNGGYIHFILGNHEIMNFNGDWRYVHPKYTQASRSSVAALYYGNDELWKWLATKNIAEKIGDILFVHGGIATELLHWNYSLSEINKISRPYYAKAKEALTDPFVNLIFNSDMSPFWYRGYYEDKNTENQIDAVLDYFGVKTLVTGHTIVNAVSSFFNGKVINIDTNHAEGKSEALLIENNKFYRVDQYGKKYRIK